MRVLGANLIKSSHKSINYFESQISRFRAQSQDNFELLVVQTAKRYRHAVSLQLVDPLASSPFRRNRGSQSTPSVHPWPDGPL